jgi:CheY-like chemotaxis protein
MSGDSGASSSQQTPGPGDSFKNVPRGHEVILLIEDDRSVRTVARQILELFGYTVLESGNGDEALRICHEYTGPIHLVLTDVVMPNLNGIELAQMLAALRPGTRTLFMSAYVGDAVLLGEIPGGEHCFLKKPFTASVLAAKVREVLDRST